MQSSFYEILFSMMQSSMIKPERADRLWSDFRKVSACMKLRCAQASRGI
ncbi:hypothetical protein HMPREF0762_00701 [Slackia exigua ATCC 700122]|uniref:Uncharacterized protein n=1 Tax=Slackia exigua (strain ATCC 700122 / DSM 15923 / CIP 105133 / JCM 11022 / KCTC 5966 / S-7) TaxID=649764 RepID=D0WFV0_SLAES|nr:hypothetical protein HMPREF0762_00701 [Slackia exigua ATCC 700122]